MTSLKMMVESRSHIGTTHVNKLRSEDMIPGVIYKKGEETKHVQVKNPEFERVYRVAGTTSIIDLELDGKIHPVIIKEVQKHPVKNQYLHIDFQELSMDEVVRVFVPINLINRDNIRLQPSVLTQLIDEVEVECLPKDIPSAASVDVADMDFTTPIFVKDLDIASDDKITILTELESVVCTLSEPAHDGDADEEAAEDGDAEVPLVSEESEE